MLNGNDIIKLGYKGPLVGLALKAVRSMEAAQYGFSDDNDSAYIAVLRAVESNPNEFYVDNELLEIKHLALHWMAIRQQEKLAAKNTLRDEPLPLAVFNDGVEIEQGAIDQMQFAMRVPVAVKGAVMADGHQGYGICIGGVWALDGAVSPNAVGNDIACQVNLTVFNVPFESVSREKLVDFLNRDTVFGYNVFKRDFSGQKIFGREEWRESPYLSKHNMVRENAIKQFASSGDGNHYAEFGMVSAEGYDEPRLAFVTHWGSRKMGALVADYFHDIAVKECVGLPKEGEKVAWLDTESDYGQDYIRCMNLCADYASEAHHYVHTRAAWDLKADSIFSVQSIHNVATFENNLWVHRKGATPANRGELAVIPGSMTTETFVVEGLGNADSLNSASHGAGRKMSRGAAKRNLDMDQMQELLKDADVTLIGAAIDESPEAYKDIHRVMTAQKDLVKVVSTFHPKVVKMAP